MTASPFVGRVPELAEVSRSLGEAADGRGALLVVVGEPGIGKTRFAVEAAREAARRGFAVFEASCHPGRDGRSYGPWIHLLGELAVAFDLSAPGLVPAWAARLLADLIPDLAARLPRAAAETIPDDPVQARFALFDAIATLLTRVSERRPLLIALDDVHEADAASSLLLAFAGRQVGHSRLLLLATARDLRRPAPIPEALVPLASEARTVPLRGLAVEDLQRLVEVRAGRAVPAAFSHSLHRRTEGNPFFVEEILRVIASEGRFDDPERLAHEPPGPPSELRDLILRRLVPLGERGRAAVDAAAVLGPRFSQVLLRHTSGLSVAETFDAIEDMVRAGVVVETSRGRGEYVFSHGLVRETVYESLPPARRGALHRRAVAAYDALFAPDVDPVLGELARHTLASSDGGDLRRAVEVSARAGRQALGRFAYEEAADHLRGALAALEGRPDADPALRGALGLDLAEARRRGGSPGAADVILRRVAADAREAGLAEPFARAALGLGVVRGAGVEAFDGSGRVDTELQGLLEEALGRLPGDDSPLRARLLGRLATCLYWGERSRDRRASLVRAAVSVAVRTGDADAIASALASRRYALWGPDDPAGRLADADDLLRAAQASGNVERELQARQWRVWDFLQLGRVHEAGGEIRRFTALAERARQPFYLGYATMFRGLQSFLAGRFEEGERLAGEGLELSRRAGNEVAPGLFGSQVFYSNVARGRLGSLAGVMPADAALQPDRLPVERCGMLFVLVAGGRLDEAREGFEALATTGFADVREDVTWLPAMSLLAHVCVALGDDRRAAVLFERLVPYRGHVVVTGPPPAVCFGLVSQALGALAVTAGDRSRGIACYEDALREATAMGAVVFEAEARCALGEVLLDGDPGRARELLEQALEVARRLDLATIVARVEAARPRGLRPATEGWRDAPPAANVVHRRGDLWEISFEGRSILVKDAKGIRYLAELLLRAGEPVRASVLAAGPAGAARDAASAERDRKAVRNRIRSAIARIRRHDPILGTHLDRSIRTGAACCYEPGGPVAWSVRA